MRHRRSSPWRSAWEVANGRGLEPHWLVTGVVQRERRKEASVIALSNSIHLYARPDTKEQLLYLYL